VTKICLERLLTVSSRLLVRRERSYVIHNATADISAEFFGHGVNTTVDVIDRQSLTLTLGCIIMSVRYDGALRRRHLLISVHSLNKMRCRTGSQYSSTRMVPVIWSNLRLPVTSFADAFNTDCRSGRRWTSQIP